MSAAVIEDTHNHQAEDPAALVKFKIQCLLFILASAIAGGLLPLKLRVQERLLSLGNTLSGGVFLAAGFTHMLAEAVEGFEELGVHEVFGHLPVPYILCIFGLLLTFFVEKVIFEGGHDHHNMGALLTNSGNTSNEAHNHTHAHSHTLNMSDHEQHQQAELSRGILKQKNSTVTNLNMYVLAGLLSVHSLVEGIALGVEDNIPDATNVFIAIIGHKMFAAFAFGVSLAKNNVPTQKLINLVIVFSIMTPSGIILGLSAYGSVSNSFVSEGIKALSSGTFIYIALVEVIMEEFENPKDKYLKFVFLILGVLIMCGLSSQHAH